MRRGASGQGNPLQQPRLAPRREVIDLATVTTGEWEDVDLTGTLPDDFDEPIELTAVCLQNASLVAGRLDRSRFVDVVVESSDLSGVELQEATLTRVEVRNSRLPGAQLALTRMRDVRFVDCQLDGANFAQSTSERLRFERCLMAASDFSAARALAVAWWDCDLTEAQFSQAKVGEAQLHGSTIDGARGLRSLAPISIDQEQVATFAAVVLAALGIAVGPRLGE